MMGVRLKVLFFALSCCFLLLCGCNTEDKGVKSAVNLLGLTADDFDYDMEKFGDEIYVDKPFVAEKDYLYSGYLILERYFVQFRIKTSGMYFVKQDIVRVESAEENRMVFKNLTSKVNMEYSEITNYSSLGDESFFGEKTEDIWGKQTPYYFMSFRIRDVLVIIEGRWPDGFSDFLNLGKTVEGKIKKVL